LDFKAELFDSAREALSGSILIDVGKVERSEITIRHVIAQNMVSGRKNGGGHYQDGLLWTAASSES
jgi:hypothetical protein